MVRKHPGRGKRMYRSIVDPWLPIEARNGRLQQRIVDLTLPVGQALHYPRFALAIERVRGGESVQLAPNRTRQVSHVCLVPYEPKAPVSTPTGSRPASSPK